MCFIAFSCNKKEEPIVKEPQCKLSEYSYIIANSPYATTTKYVYNLEGKLSEIYNFNSLVFKYTYEKNLITINEYSQNKLSNTSTILLDDFGRAIKWKARNRGYEAKYTNDGYIKEIIVFDEPDFINPSATVFFKYENQNLVEIIRATNGIAPDESTLIYTEVPNKISNIWYTDFPVAWEMGFSYSYLINIWGKRSKYLLKEWKSSYDNEEFSYELDNRGNVVKVRIKNSSSDDTFFASYRCD